MRLHTAITDKFRTLDAPRGGDGIVRATTALDHVLGRLDAAGIIVGRVLTQEHIVDDELHPGFHFAHRTVQDRCVVWQVGELLFHARIARHVQTFEQLRAIGCGQNLLAPDALGLNLCVGGGGFRSVSLQQMRKKGGNFIKIMYIYAD